MALKKKKLKKVKHGKITGFANFLILDNWIVNINKTIEKEEIKKKLT